MLIVDSVIVKLTKRGALSGQLPVSPFKDGRLNFFFNQFELGFFCIAKISNDRVSF